MTERTGTQVEYSRTQFKAHPACSMLAKMSPRLKFPATGEEMLHMALLSCRERRNPNPHRKTLKPES